MVSVTTSNQDEIEELKYCVLGATVNSTENRQHQEIDFDENGIGNINELYKIDDELNDDYLINLDQDELASRLRGKTDPHMKEFCIITT